MYTYMNIHIHINTCIYHCIYTMYIHHDTYTYIYMDILTRAGRKLTDDDVSTLFLANDCRIAAQKNRNRGNIWACRLQTPEQFRTCRLC